MLHVFFENAIYRKHREKLLLILDLLIVLFSYLIAYWSKNDFQLRTMQLGLTGTEVAVGLLVLLIVYAFSFAFFKVYKSLWKYIGVDELLRLTASNILAMINYNFLTKTPREIDQLIASRIRSIRKRRKISQKRLSEKSGVSLGSVKRFEQNGEISLISLTKIAIALEIEGELEDLFEEVPFLSIEEVAYAKD